jgi:hypothetical protein
LFCRKNLKLGVAITRLLVDQQLLPLGARAAVSWFTGSPKKAMLPDKNEAGHPCKATKGPTPPLRGLITDDELQTALQYKSQIIDDRRAQQLHQAVRLTAACLHYMLETASWH